MSKQRNKKGFTLAEIMMAVAIIGILSAVAFIGVARYLRSMAQLERDGIAREIYVAAQNHLAMAEGQGYLNRDLFGNVEARAGEEKGVYYYIVNRGTIDPNSDAFSNSALGLMLPFAAVDETVRTGGNYIIRYQAKPANVLDVFYCPSSGRFTQSFSQTDYASLISGYSGENKKAERRFYDNNVIGWCGGEENVLKGAVLKAPEIQVINKEKLTVEVIDSNYANSDARLQLIVTGKMSGAQKSFVLSPSVSATEPRCKWDVGGKYVVTLDDITTRNMHFCDLDATVKGPFIPGEDITIKAVSDSIKVISNIVDSGDQTTNSLFLDLEAAETSTVEDDETGVVTTTLTSSKAGIANIRHLENLSPDISKVNVVRLDLNAAVQKSNLNWKTFKTAIMAGTLTEPTVYNNDYSKKTVEGCFYPVNIDYALSYDGLYEGNTHSISDVLVNNTVGDKGVFGSYGVSGETCSIRNIDLVNCNFNDQTTDEATGNAGALAGTLVNTAVENVIAYNNSEYDKSSNILTVGSPAGGLVGEMQGGSMSLSAAALYVTVTGSGRGDAGGLIGKTSGTVTINGCYSGGHTQNGAYFTVEERTENGNTITSRNPFYNITGIGKVGGLVGDADSATITNSYSTCSVSGDITGGFVGSGSGTITNCYCTGLVGGATKEGAFAGSFSETASASGCSYFEIINEREVKGTGEAADDVIGYEYLKSVGGNVDAAGITAFDADVTSYDSFITGAMPNADAVPYDSVLGDYYQDKYFLKTVAQLGSTVAAGSYVEKHYGDWPAPETFVINTAGGGAAGG